MIGRSTRHSSQVLVRRPSVEPTAIVLRCRVFQENRLFVFRNVRERRPQIEGHIGEYARGSRAANATDCRRFGCVQIFTIIRTTLMAQLNRAIAKRLVGDHLRSLKTMKIRSEATTAK